MEDEPNIPPEISELWMIALIAEAFHVLPSIVARDIETDPNQLSAKCLHFLRYRDAYQAFKAAKKQDDLKSWEGSKMMDAVITNDFELKKLKRQQKQG